MLEVRNLSVAYGGLRALADVTLSVAEGRFVTIVGPNGAGKSTLFKTISGVVPPVSGRITFAGENLLLHRPSDRAHLGIAHVPEGRQVFKTLSVRENLEMGAYPKTGHPVGAHPRAHPHPVPHSRGARWPAGGHAVGGRTADAGHRPRARGRPPPPHAGRTVNGPRPQRGRSDLRAHLTDPPRGRADHPPRGAARG